MTIAQRIFKNFLFLSSAEIVSKTISFIAMVYLARVLGAEGFGKLGFATAILAYFMLLTNLGLNTYGTREVARNNAEINRYLNNIITIKLIAATITFILLGIFVCFLPKPLEVKKLILFMGLTLFTSAFLIDWLFQGIERMEFIAISRIAYQLCYAILVFLIVKTPEQILKIPFIQIAAVISAIIILFSIYKTHFKSVRLDFEFSFWKDILRRSIPMGFSFVMITIYYNFDHVMLGFMKNMEVVGWYSAAYKIILLVLTLPGLILAPFFPILSKYYKEDTDQLYRVTNKFVMVMFTVGIPIGFGGTILAPEITRLAYGSGFDQAVLPLQILMWNVVLVFINVAYGNPLLAWDRQKKYMKIIATGAITNLIFNFLLIPKFSLVGAALATVLAEVAVFFGLYFEFQKTVKIDILKYSIKPLIASIVMIVCIRIASRFYYNILPLFLMGVSIYLVSILALKVVTVEDLRLIFVKNRGALP